MKAACQGGREEEVEYLRRMCLCVKGPLKKVVDGLRNRGPKEKGQGVAFRGLGGADLNFGCGGQICCGRVQQSDG